MSYDFLLASWGTSGNLNPLLTAARQLRRSGHHVRVMADPSMRGEVEAADFDMVSWRRAPLGTAADPTDVSDIGEWIFRALFAPAAAYAADIRDEIQRAPTDAVLSLDALLGAVLGAEAAGVPIALLAPHINPRPLPGVPHFSSPSPQPKTAEERAQVAAAAAEWCALVDGSLPTLNKACAELGVPRVSTIVELFDRADRFLLAISRAFDFEAEALPENVRYVGPLLDQPSWSQPWQAPWSQWTGHPHVLVTCSTGAQGQHDLFQRIIDAMGLLDVEAVVTAGPNVSVADLSAPANVHLLQSAPHNSVMRDVSLVITQGGHGTVCRALIHGLPLLVMPLGRDQASNATRVEAKGAGLQLPPDASPSEIAAAVKRLIDEPQFAEAACRLGKAITADVDASRLVDEMEAIVSGRRRKKIVPLRSSSLHA